MRKEGGENMVYVAVTLVIVVVLAFGFLDSLRG